MSNDTKITEEQITECFGGLEKYESIAMQVAQILIEEIKSKGLERQFENIDIMNEFIYPYLQSWVEANKDNITKVLEMKRKVFTKEDIEEYIKFHSKTPQELLELKFKELFEGKDLTDEERKRKENLENQPEKYTTEEAIEELKNENEEQIQKCRHSYSEGSFNSKLKQDISYGFLKQYSNPKDFQLNFNAPITQKLIRGNTEFKISTNENEDYDFLVNQVQIVATHHLGLLIIEVYVPDKEYPEGMTRSDLIQKEKEDACEKELKALYQKFQQQGVDVSAVSKRILGLEREDLSEQAK